MAPRHEQLAAGRWHTLSLMEQLGNVGSDVARAARWYGKEPHRCQQAFERALELLDLTIADGRWKGRRKELTRARELLCDAMFGGHTYGSDFTSLDRYFFHFAMAARAGR
ncbi:MAG: hypothetical protein WAU05_14530 [Nitrospira sp.]